jgi:hypothetical protein
MKRTFNGRQYDLYERFPNDFYGKVKAQTCKEKLLREGHEFVRMVKINEFDYAVFYLG